MRAIEVTDFSAVGEYTGGSVDNAPSLAGFAAARRNAGVQHERRVREAARLYADALLGRIEPWLLQEAMYPRNEFVVRHLMESYPGLYPERSGHPLGLRETMSFSDYQALFVDVLDRIYYGYYSAFPIVNLPLVKRHNLRDFRVVSRYLLDGVVSPLTAMDPASPPPQRALLGPDPQNGHPATSTAPQQYQPKLYQSMTSVNWRAFVNDDLGIFRDLANRLAIAGNRGITKFITTQFVSSTGLNTGLYQANYGNLVTPTYGAASTNPALSPQGIIDALKVLARMRDSGGDPIMITGGMYLVYGPALKGVAESILNQTKTMMANAGDLAATTNFPTQWVETNSWYIRDMTPVMDPYIPIVCTTGTTQDTLWYIVVDPNTQNRPAVEFGQLTGYETPQLYSKLPNTQRLGGGVDALMGDFYSMDQDMKVVTVMGALQVDGRSTVGSTGRGA